ncbi:MAG: 3-oxoacyl-ACP synthase, partial [Muribaculaceae bacterium]|nr:3-oxoacyl-ACP synthase [Muribaculaceae bacterium]
VYTLANIVTGEIAIRHKIYGETSFYVMPAFDPGQIDDVAEDLFQTSSPSFVLTGWVDYNDDNDYLADMKIMTR